MNNLLYTCRDYSSLLLLYYYYYYYYIGVYWNRSPIPWFPDTGVILGLRSGFVLSVWFFSFAANTYFWRYFGVNNVLIFEFDPRNHLNFQQLFAVRETHTYMYMYTYN